MTLAPLGDNRCAGVIDSAQHGAVVFLVDGGFAYTSPALVPAPELPPSPLATSDALAAALIEAVTAREAVQAPPPLVSLAACAKLTAELQSLGWDCVRRVQDNFGAVTLVHVDDAGRVHACKLLLDAEGHARDALVDLPLALALPPKAAVSTAYGMFKTLVARFQPLWAELERIDGACRVLDPALPAPLAVTYRRLGLQSGDGALSAATLHVQLPLDNPAQAPCGCDLVGPDTMALEFRAGVRALFREWDANASVLANLQAHLALAPPAAPGQAESALMDSGECGICYAYRLPSATGDAELPDVACSCRRPFHRSCLLGWLRALPSAKRSFRLVAGECPYCNAEVVIRE